MTLPSAGGALLALLGLCPGLLAAGADPSGQDPGAEDHWSVRAALDGLKEPSGDAFEPSFTRGPAWVQVPLADHAWDAAGILALRNYGGWDFGNAWRMEWNALAVDAASSAGLTPTAQPVGRTALLERRVVSEPDQAVDVEIDQWNLRWQGERVNLVAGRQSVNLGQNFYFSPLDLFQPFQPQDTYRDFRAGVDAARATVSLGTLTQVEALAVAGYRGVTEGANVSRDPLCLDGPQGQASVLGRAESGGDAWAVTVLGGRFTQREVGGASFQVETLGSSWLVESLAERDLDAPPGQVPWQVDTTVGWTRQWTSWLSARAEWNGRATGAAYPPTDAPFFPHRQAAVSATFQATPLWILTPFMIWEGDPGQAEALLDAAWSSSENGSLHLILETPIQVQQDPGPGRDPTQVESQPSAVSVDYRWIL